MHSLRLAWPRIEQLAPGFSVDRRPSHPDCPGHGAPRRGFDRRVDQWGLAAFDQQSDLPIHFPAWAGRVRRSAASTWPLPRHIRAAACRGLRRERGMRRFGTRDFHRAVLLGGAPGRSSNRTTSESRVEDGRLRAAFGQVGEPRSVSRLSTSIRPPVPAGEPAEQGRR